MYILYNTEKKIFLINDTFAQMFRSLYVECGLIASEFLTRLQSILESFIWITLNFQRIFTFVYILALKTAVSYMQCTPPPPGNLDLFPKPCESSFDCFPNLCCQENGKRYCRPPKRSILALIAELTQVKIVTSILFNLKYLINISYFTEIRHFRPSQKSNWTNY